jgi:hypothetical protein
MFVSHAARMRRGASLRRQRGKPLGISGMVLPWQVLACAHEAVRGTEEKTSAQPNASLAVLIKRSNKPLALTC